MNDSASLQIQQLVELLAVVSSLTDEASALQGAAERAAQALEAEVAVVVLGGRVKASIGFPLGAVPDEEVLAVARHERDKLDVPGLGVCAATAAAWAGTHPGHLVLARWADERFSVEERNLVRGMARVLELTLTMQRTLRAEHEMRERLEERQRLLEHLFDIQRAISRRRPLQQILETVTHAAQDLFGDEVVGLWLRDPADPGRAKLKAFEGLRGELAKRLPALAMADAGEAGEAMRLDAVVSRDGGVSAVLARLAGRPLHASLAAPVHDSGAVTGSLLVASGQPNRTYSAADEQMLQAFAEHVSLALTDANTVDRMYQAFHDSLTGLAGRSLFLERMTQQFASAHTDGEQVALLFVDLDLFKAVNDTLGHAAGDQVLMIAAERIKSQLRVGDLAGRFGGDEFAVMLSQVRGVAEAEGVAERICAALRLPMAVAGQQVAVDASIGVAIGAPGQTDPAALMRAADIAMYHAKRAGRGRHEVYAEAMALAFGPTTAA